MNSRQQFVLSIAGLCQMRYKATRELVPGSLSVHLLRDSGKIYGAIQTGRHQFYGQEDSKPKYLTSTADFTHLWIVEDGQWKLRRILSYNHVEANF